MVWGVAVEFLGVAVVMGGGCGGEVVGFGGHFGGGGGDSGGAVFVRSRSSAFSERRMGGDI